MMGREAAAMMRENRRVFPLHLFEITPRYAYSFLAFFLPLLLDSDNNNLISSRQLP